MRSLAWLSICIMASATPDLFPRHPLATPSSGIRFAAQNSNQRTVLAAFVKKVGLQVLQGADLTKISLPIEVFEPRTFLERLPLELMHAPRLLHLAASAETHLERFQLCVAFMISGRNTTAQSADKPLNPCLGETYQGVFDDGSLVFAEQVLPAGRTRRVGVIVTCGIRYRTIPLPAACCSRIVIKSGKCMATACSRVA